MEITFGFKLVYQRLNYSHLYYFHAISRAGSIKQACKELHLTQPTLSGQLRALEDYLGHKLFERQVRRLRLNEKGKIALEYANRIFRMGDELVSSVRTGIAQPKEVLQIGIVPSLSKTHLFELMKPLFSAEKYTVQIKEAPLRYLLRELRSEEMDLIFSDAPAGVVGMAIHNRKLSKRKLIAVASKKMGSLKKGFPRSLSGAPFFNYSGESFLRGEIEHFFRNENVSPKTIGEADDVNLLRAGAESGICFCILPESMVRKQIRQGSLILLGTPRLLDANLWMLSLENSSQTHVRIAMDQIQTKSPMNR